MRGEQPRAYVEVQLHPIARPPCALEVHVITGDDAYGATFAVHAHIRSRRPPGDAQRKSPAAGVFEDAQPVPEADITIEPLSARPEAALDGDGSPRQRPQSRVWTGAGVDCARGEPWLNRHAVFA